MGSLPILLISLTPLRTLSLSVAAYLTALVEIVAPRSRIVAAVRTMQLSAGKCFHRCWANYLPVLAIVEQMRDLLGAIRAPMSNKYSCVASIALLKREACCFPSAITRRSSARILGRMPMLSMQWSHGDMSMEVNIMLRGQPEVYHIFWSMVVQAPLAMRLRVFNCS